MGLGDAHEGFLRAENIGNEHDREIIEQELINCPIILREFSTQ